MSEYVRRAINSYAEEIHPAPSQSVGIGVKPLHLS